MIPAHAPAPSESPPQSPPSEPASAPPTPPPPSPAPAPRSPSNERPRDHSHPVRARQPQSSAEPLAPGQTESFPAPAHSESSAGKLSDQPPTPRDFSANARSRPSLATP